MWMEIISHYIYMQGKGDINTMWERSLTIYLHDPVQDETTEMSTLKVRVSCYNENVVHNNISKEM